MMQEETVHRPKSNDGNQRCVEQVSAPSFINRLNGSIEDQSICNNLVIGPSSRPKESCDFRPGNNGILAMCHLHKDSPGPILKDGPNGKGILSLNHSSQIRPPANSSTPLRKVKNIGGKKAQFEGFSSFSRLYGHKVVHKPISKSIIYRPVAAAIAQSDLSKAETSQKNYLIQEATAIQLGKTLGLNYNGQEDVALTKIIKLELNDKERINKDGKAK
ncbi:hypothetical protein ACSBR1_012280 [Camellia fascicularis]